MGGAGDSSRKIIAVLKSRFIILRWTESIELPEQNINLHSEVFDSIDKNIIKAITWKGRGEIWRNQRK